MICVMLLIVLYKRHLSLYSFSVHAHFDLVTTSDDVKILQVGVDSTIVMYIALVLSIR